MLEAEKPTETQRRSQVKVVIVGAKKPMESYVEPHIVLRSRDSAYLTTYRPVEEDAITRLCQ